MGYGISQNLMYGVVLDPEQSRQLREHIQSEFPKFKTANPVLIQESEWEDEWDDQINMILDMLFGESNCNMIAQDSDSRIHNTTYEDGCEHGFGVVLARLGYGTHTTSREFNAKMNAGPTQQDIDQFAQHCQHMLDAIGVTEPPTLQVVSYTA